MCKPVRFTCDHCRWQGEASEATTHPRLLIAVCPDCWAEGFEAPVRELMGPLMEAFNPPDPQPRQPKAMADWTDEEWEVQSRICRAREAHEQAPVLLATTIDGARQAGFDFMREEFRVKPYAKRRN